MYFPIFLDLRGKACLVIGDGKVARHKAKCLREAGAKVSVLRKASSFSRRSVRKYFLVVAATSDRVLNARVSKACGEAGRLVNVVDNPALCNFVYGASFRKGPLQVAFSTGGASPPVARSLRRLMEQKLKGAWPGYLNFLACQRIRILAAIPDPALRRRLLLRAGDQKILSLVSKGKLAQAKREFLKGVRHTCT